MLHRAPFRSVGVITLITLLFTLFAGMAPAHAAPPELKLDANAAILMDWATGQVLWEKNADTPIPPASLTKLMTLHIAFKKLAEGSLKSDDKVNITRDAWAATMPGSSVMQLEPGQNVTVAEIMKGVAIPSGNDASVALAQHISGSVDAFVALMNKEAQEMGYKTMRFVDPHGLSAKNQVTAREFADFSRRYVQMYPQALSEYHSVKEFVYPLYENLPPERKAGLSKEQYRPPHPQYNRNTLLGTFPGVDGLKTGFIDESGYNIALTALRGEMRLVAVILGVPGRNEAEGSAKRAEAGAALLSWGFNNFTTVKPQVPALSPVRVWKGAANEVTLEPERPIVLTVAKELESKVTPQVTQETSVIAPVKKGDKLGEVVFTADGTEIARVPLVAAADVEPGGFFKRLWDTIRLTVAGWFTKE